MERRRIGQSDVPRRTYSIPGRIEYVLGTALDLDVDVLAMQETKLTDYQGSLVSRPTNLSTAGWMVFFSPAKVVTNGNKSGGVAIAVRARWADCIFNAVRGDKDTHHWYLHLDFHFGSRTVRFFSTDVPDKDSHDEPKVLADRISKGL